MTHYLIEFRFSGYLKSQIKELIRNISENHHVYGVTRRHVVPHITMVGPLHTNDEKRLVKEFKNIVSKYKLTTFRLNGFDTFDRRVIFVNVEPSEELQTIRNEIIENLKEFCSLDEHDYEPEFRPHATRAIPAKTTSLQTLSIWKSCLIETTDWTSSHTDTRASS